LEELSIWIHAEFSKKAGENTHSYLKTKTEVKQSFFKEIQRNGREKDLAFNMLNDL